MSYIASEADDFEALNERYFTLDEIANLLASSHHQQRLYALSLLTKTVARPENAELVFGTVLNPETSQISTRL